MKSTNRIRKKNAIKGTKSQASKPPNGFEQMAKPLPTPQQRMIFRTLESSVDATASLLTMLAQDADSGLKNVTEIVISKLNSDFAAASVAFKMSAQPNEVAS
jgi:hypothetical protein